MMNDLFLRYRKPIFMVFLGIAAVWFYRFGQPSGINQGGEEHKTGPENGSDERAGRKIGKENRADLSPEEKLNGLLPKWIREKGELYQEPHDLNGQSIPRSRARYEWKDGKRLEIEISDLGASADPEIAKGLGFNFDLTNEESETGYTMTQADEVYLLNEEYDQNDQAGSLQLFIEKRFLLEIQIEGLPHEAFQEILNEDVLFEKLYGGEGN